MWIKICGITTPEDGRTAVAAGADAIGLNFYKESPRCVDSVQAGQIADAVRADVDVVGVFVNHPLKELSTCVEDFGLTAVQFHGDETPADIAQLQAACPHVCVIRAIRLGAGARQLQSALGPLNNLVRPLDGLLVDAFVRGEYGGTGRIVHPDLLQDHHRLTPRLVLAGGLTPANVADAATNVRPWGVDTASGVESQPGKKSARLVHDFVTQCRTVPGANSRFRLASRPESR